MNRSCDFRKASFEISTILPVEAISYLFEVYVGCLSHVHSNAFIVHDHRALVMARR